jgi:hypothetical protein
LRRVLFWAALAVAVAALVGGAVYAYVGYRAVSGPEGAVRGYFAALARSDAPAALGFGTVPDGPHDLLTSDVLAEQQRIAPLRDVRIADVVHNGSQATVRFSYRLAFVAGTRQVTGSVRVVHGGASWRLAQTAVPTAVRLDQAADRVSFAGSSVPTGPTLLFPGALPIRFDTAYLRLAPDTAAVGFGSAPVIDLRVEPTASARAQLSAALAGMLAGCASGPPPSADCPLPSSRYVPGSLHGRILSRQLSFGVSSAAAGTITATGTAFFEGGYQRLAYDNVAEIRRGRLSLPVSASSYAVAPLSPRFTEQT